MERDRKRALAQPQLQSPTAARLHCASKLLEAHLEASRGIDYGGSEEHSDERTSLPPEDTDPEQLFNHKWGYLPPLDEESAAIIDIIIAHPEMAEEFKRINSRDNHFMRGLLLRRVMLDEAVDVDPYVDFTRGVIPEVSVLETPEERRSHDQLWSLDQANCSGASNEALFQRTFMMNLISRHTLIYDRDANSRSCLDFSVEEPWTCPPMPTEAYELNIPFLTCPKPDLAVCFRTQSLIPNPFWSRMPNATTRLAYYENPNETGQTKAFHFFTIEAKRAMTSSDNLPGKHQSLNNASQALHNMYEFCKDAGTEYESGFFAKVRFFSVVASTEGLTIRIHRATLDPEVGYSGYPLKFEYQTFSKIEKDTFDRKQVHETFAKILIGYGANELHAFLSKAAEALIQRLHGNGELKQARENFNFYRYGQTRLLGSKKNTPYLSRPQSALYSMMPSSRYQSAAQMSVDMIDSRSITPGQGQPPQPANEGKNSKKRTKVRSEVAKVGKRKRL